MLNILLSFVVEAADFLLRPSSQDQVRSQVEGPDLNEG